MFFLFWSRLIQYKIIHQSFLLSSLYQQSFDRCSIAMYIRKSWKNTYISDTKRKKSTQEIIFNSSFCDIFLFCGFPSVRAVTLPYSIQGQTIMICVNRLLHSTSLCQGFFCKRFRFEHVSEPGNVQVIFMISKLKAL